jgi:hypothetical protein
LGDRTPDPRECSVGWNGLNTPAANIIETPLCLSGPKLAESTVRCGVEAFHQSVSKKSPRFGGQRECFCGDLFNSHAHRLRIQIGVENLKANLRSSGVQSKHGSRDILGFVEGRVD